MHTGLVRHPVGMDSPMVTRTGATPRALGQLLGTTNNGRVAAPGALRPAPAVVNPTWPTPAVDRPDLGAPTDPLLAELAHEEQAIRELRRSVIV